MRRHTSIFPKQIKVLNPQVSATATSGTTISLSYEVSDSINTVLIAWVCWTSSIQALSSITYNSVSMTAIASNTFPLAANDPNVFFMALSAPSTGINTLTATFGTAFTSTITGKIVVFHLANTTGTFSSTSSNSTSTTAAASTAFSATSANDFGFDCVIVDNGETQNSPSEQIPLVSQFSLANGGNNPNFSFTYRPCVKAPNTATTFSRTWTSSIDSGILLLNTGVK